MKLQSEVLPKLTLLPLTQQKLMHLRKQIQRVHSYAQLHRELTKITNIKIKKHSYELFDLIGGIKNVSLNLLWSHKQGMINESRDYQELHVFFSQMINPLLKETNQYLGQNLFALDEMKQKVQAMQSHLVSIISEIKRFTKVFDPNYNVDVQVGVPKDPDDEAEVEYFKDPDSFFTTNSLPLSPPPDLRQRQRSSQRSPLLTQSQTHRVGQKGRNTDLRKSLDRVTMNNNNSPTNDFTITQRTNNTDIFNNIQTVKIKVIEAFHCQPSQFHSMFVILRADNQWKQTGLVSRAQKPVWNEIHTLLMSCREPLEITLMDQDKEGFDYFRGQCYLDIENLDQGQLLDLLIDLKDEDDEIAPEKLHLLFQRTPCNQIGIAKPEDEVNLFYPRQNQQKEPVKKKSRSKSKGGFPSPAHSFAPNTSFRHLLQITLTDLEEFQQLVGIEIKKLRKKIPLIKSQEMMGREMIRASESLIEYLLLKLPQIEAERILTAELSIRGMHGGQTFYDPNRISRGGDYFVPSLDQINKAMEAVDHAVQVSDSEVNLEESQKKLKGKNVGTHILTQKDLSAQNLSPSKEKGNSGLVYNHDVGAQAIVSNKDIGAMAYYSQRDMSAMAYNSQRDMSAQNTLHSYKNISQQYTGRVPQNKSIQHSRRGHSQGVQNIVSQKDMTQQYTQLSEVDEGIQYTNNITEKGLQYSNHGQDRSIQNIQSHKDQSIQNLQENKDQSIQKQQSIMNKSIQNLQSLRDESVQNLVMLQDQSVSNFYDNRDKSVQNLVDQRDQSLSNLYDARDQSIQNLYECRSMSIQNVQDYKDQNIQNIQDMRDKSIQNLALHKDADVQNMPEMKEMAAQYSQRELLPNENLDAQFFDSTGLGYQSFNDLKSSLEAINSDFRQSLTWEIRELIKTIQGQQKEFQDAMESALATAINPSGDGQDAVDPVFAQDLDKSGFAELEKAKFLLQKNQKRIEEKQKQQQEQLIKKFEEFIGKKQQEFNVQQLEVLRDIKRSLQLLEQLQESMNTVNTGVNDVHDYLKQRLITKSKQETYQENLELKALDFIQNTTGVGFMKKKSSYALAQFESYMAAQIAPDLIAVHNKLCSVDIIKFPQMTHVALINPEMRNCFSALGGRETFYLGMVDGVAEYDYRTFTKQKVFNTKSYVYHIYGFDNQCIVCCQKEGYIQVLAREDFSLLIDTQLSDKVSIGEMKKTSRPYEVMFATSRAVIFGFLQRNQDVDQGITFKENFDEKYVIAKGVDSIIEYYKDQLAICTNDGISLINRATRQVSFFIQNPNKSTPRFIKELPGLNMNDYPYLLFRDEVNMYIVDLKNKRLYNILKVTYTKNYLCKYQTFIVNGPNQPLELVVLQYDDRDSTVTHYVMKDQYHHALQVLKDM